MRIFIVLLVVLGIFVFVFVSEPEPIKCFSENGKLFSIIHIDRKGLPHGEVVTFHPSGEVYKHLQFVHGEMVKGCQYSENGDLLIRWYEDENLQLRMEKVK